MTVTKVKSRPMANQAARSVTSISRPALRRADTSSQALAVPCKDVLDREALRLLHECLINGTRAYWERRAQTFEAARPAPGDYLGQATRQELSEQWHRLTALAEACRARAAVTGLPDEPEQDVVNVWQEASSA